MGVAVLRPIEGLPSGGTFRGGGAKQQAVAALPAPAAPPPVGADRLIDELWGDDPPGNPTNALQALVSQLRRQLGRDSIERLPQGYAVAVDMADVDAHALEQTVRAGRAASEA